MTQPVKTLYQLIPVSGLPDIWSMRSSDRLAKQLFTLKKQREQRSDCELIVREDVIFDTAVLQGLLGKANIAVMDDSNTIPYGACVKRELAGVTAMWLAGNGVKPVEIETHNAANIASAYNLALRKRENPRCQILTADNARQVEWNLFMTAYKGVTDLVTKYAWPRPAFAATRWCAKQGITPNQVTAVSGLLVLVCMWLFAHGLFGLGMLCAWLMTFLDTVDGKLARVTLTSSPLGNIFDHGIDLIHPPFWYYAWAVGLAASSTPIPEGWFTPLMWLIFGGYIAGRLCEGYFARRYGMHMHVWRRIDSQFRLIMARRNPNMILMQLSLCIARPDIGLYAVAAWTVICVLIQCVQVAQAESFRLRGNKIVSWLDAQ